MPHAVYRRARRTTVAAMELLEQRALLSWNNFPTTDDLLAVSDTVVRLQTNFGDIDLELFDVAAPATVANFLDYIRDGDYDKTFFHRLTRDDLGDPITLEGGGFRLHGPTTTGPFNGASPADQAWESVPLDQAVANQFGRSNLARTLAMARTAGQADSAASRFFFNLRDNTSFDTIDGGFTVFGRVATDESWAVVQAIISGTTPSDQGGEFDQLPTVSTAGFTGVDADETQLVTVRDAEIIKPRGSQSFYTTRVYYPEGFAGSNINEFLPLGNPGSATLFYQVIARAENRDPLPGDGSDFWYRDKVISTGQIGGNRRAGITVSTFSNPDGNLVPRQGKPYALEVWATDTVSATLSHYDFGSSAIEQFTSSASTAWTIPDVQRGTDTHDFVVWANTTESTAAVTLSFHPAGGGTPIEIVAATEAFRRGGVSIGDLPQLADGHYSLRITSDVPLVGALSHFKTAGADKGGATQLAIPGAGARAGVLPLAYGGTGSGDADTVTFFNPGPDATAITLIAKFDDGSADFTWTPPALDLAGGGRVSYAIEDSDALRGKTFTLLYSSSGADVFASVLHVGHGDVAGAPFVYAGASRHGFGEGFMNSARAGQDLFETLAVYNPNGSSLFGATAREAVVTLRFLFTDGVVLSEQFTIGADRSLVIDLTTYAPLLEQNFLGRYYYSLEIVSNTAVVAGMSHYDTSLGGLQPSGGGLFNGATQGGVVPLSDLDYSPVRMQLRIVPQSGGFGPASPLSLIGPVNGTVSLGAAPGMRTMRFRVDYRIQDLDLSDNIHPAGLAAAFMNITGVGSGSTGGVTVSRATLSGYEAHAGAVPPPGATDSGYSGNTGDDASEEEPNGRAGLASPFRGGMIDPNDNDNPLNGAISGLSINGVIPLTLSTQDQGLIGFDDGSGDPAFPLTGDEWYPLYVFMIIADDTSAGTVTFTASAPPDPQSGSAFGYYDDGDPSPHTATVSQDASITVNIPAV